MSQDKYKQIFRKYIGENIETIATIDHVFGSPPLRLIDSHHQLSQINNSRAILWDTTWPNIDKYRSELILDTGFLSYKHNDIFLYEVEKPYCLGKVKMPDFSLQKKLINQIFSNSHLIDVNQEKQKIYLDRLDDLINIYKKNIQVTDSASEFYKRLLENMYEFLGFPQLCKYISNNMFSLYTSQILSEYIPRMIKETANESYGYLNLLKNTDLFKSPYFRGLNNNDDTNFSDKNYVLENINDIYSLLSKKEILPHHTLYFWAWSLSGIKHFGNDYGNFNMISATLKNLGVSNEFEKLQLTEPKKDGSNFAVFNQTYTFTLLNKGKGKEIKFNNTHTKSSRASNICSIYLNSGRKIKQYWDEYVNDGTITSLDMKEIF